MTLLLWLIALLGAPLLFTLLVAYVLTSPWLDHDDEDQIF